MTHQPKDIEQAKKSGAEVVELKPFLEPVVVEDGWTMVWRHRDSGEYWEVHLEGRYDELETLIRISEEDFRSRWSDRLT